TVYVDAVGQTESSMSNDPTGPLLETVMAALRAEAGLSAEPRRTESPLPLLTMTKLESLAASGCTPGTTESKSAALTKPGSPALKRLCIRLPVAGSTVSCRSWLVSWAAEKTAVLPVSWAVNPARAAGADVTALTWDSSGSSVAPARLGGIEPRT